VIIYLKFWNSIVAFIEKFMGIYIFTGNPDIFIKPMISFLSTKFVIIFRIGFPAENV